MPDLLYQLILLAKLTKSIFSCEPKSILDSDYLDYNS